MRPVLMTIVAVVVIVGAAGAQVQTPHNSSSASSRAGAGDEAEYEDDSAWGVDGPLDNLMDDLDLEGTYPDHFSGSEVFYDENVYEVGWKGEIPQALIAELDARGQRDWVRFVPAPYNAEELGQAAERLMDRLTEAGIETHSASSFDDSSAGWVKYYDRPQGTRDRAELIAREVSDLGIPVRAIVTTEPLAVAAVG